MVLLYRLLTGFNGMHLPRDGLAMIELVENFLFELKTLDEIL